MLLLLVAFFLWPLPDNITNPVNLESTNILDRNWNLLYTVRKHDFGIQDKISFDDIPEQIISSLIAVEDRSFYSHFGISIKWILRSIYLNTISGRIVSGGSTITQQYVRGLIKPEKRSLLYKIKEMYFAIRLEMIMTKNEILENYLNNAYFWNQAYGIWAAANLYYEKNINELSLAESAFLIWIVQSPLRFNPIENFEDTVKRQKVVLTSLFDVKKVSLEQFDELSREPIKISSWKIKISTPHFISWFKQIYSNNIFEEKEIKTTIDLNLQKEIEHIIQNKLSELKDKRVTSAAAIVLDLHSWELLSMVGSADFWDEENDGQVNVTISPRQPGSALKPFTYALALESGKTAASTVADIETQFFTQEGNPYIPRNYNYNFNGLVRFREALANSYNISAVKVLEDVWVNHLLEFLKASWIKTLNKSPQYYGLALTLWDGEVKLLELTQAYGIFPRGWKTLNLKVLIDENITEWKQILDPKISWLIADIISDNDARLPEFWAGSVLNFDFPVWVKTGTTRNSRDNWTMWFTSNHLIGVWVWNADNSSMRDTSGVTWAWPIFREVVLALKKNYWAGEFTKPEWIIELDICRLSGKLPTKYCTDIISEHFIKWTEPKQYDDIFIEKKIDIRNNLLGDDCKDEFIKKEVFAIFPLELRKWARENGWKQIPDDFSPLCERGKNNVINEIEVLEIIKPNDFDSFYLDPLVPDANEKIIFEARSHNNIKLVNWFVDGKLVWSSSPPDYRMEWEPEIGSHEVLIKWEGREDKVVIEVLK